VTDRPNVLFFHVDNLGFGELSCYSGGPFRGATTSRIDAFAHPLDELLPGIAFTTLLHAARLTEPGDRVIDGVNQLDWLTGSRDASAREDYIYWMGRQMSGVKWHNFKLVLVAQRYMQDSADALPTPRLINLNTDPQERERVPVPHLHTWAATHLNRIIAEFEASTRRDPLIPMGVPLDHVPAG
jgi:arylsulfatase